VSRIFAEAVHPRHRVRNGKAQNEQILSALPPEMHLICALVNARHLVLLLAGDKGNRPD
jgi:hypothetical protein